MFIPKTEKIKRIVDLDPGKIKEIESLLKGKSVVYIDYANVFFWSRKLKWNIDIKRLKQFLDSFDNIEKVKLYNGTLKGDTFSSTFIKDAKNFGYEVVTKPVKIMRFSIDISGIPENSPSVLSRFIDKSLLKLLDIETIEYLNLYLRKLNESGTLFVEHKKCNFDVEIGRDMLLDFERNDIDTYILWSGDSDFADPVDQLIKDKKKVVIFATARRVSSELSATKVPIFDIQKIRNFICRNGQIQPQVKNRL